MVSVRRLSWFMAIAVLLTATLDARPALAQGSTASDSNVTFTKDVAPILQDKCEVCHRPNNIGPMSLISYEEVRPWARSIRSRVISREMPPWHLDKNVGIQHFLNDRSLSDQQIDTIVKWVDQGSPRGNEADMPAAKQWPSGEYFFLEEVLGPPDLIVRSKPWVMPAEGPDVLFENEVDVPQLTEPRWIRAMETKPSLSARRTAHHSNTYVLRAKTPEAIAAEEAMRVGRPEAGIKPVTPETDKEHMTEWAQGKSGEIYPDNVGKLVMPGMKFGFQTHYHAVGEDVTGTIEVGLWFHPKDKTPKYSAQFAGVTGSNGPVQIPPNSVVEFTGTTVLQAPAILHNFQPHMHYRGKAQTLEAIYPDGKREVINRVNNYTNNWHTNYIYDPAYAPVFPKGTVLLVTSVMDNTAANKNNPDPRQWVSGGDRTVDEMAHLNEQIIYITEEDYAKIAEERKTRVNTQN